MILVTGATGTIGSALMGQLKAQGLEHRALVRDAARARALLGADAPLVLGDYTDTSSLDAAMDDVSALFLLCPPHPSQSELEQAVVDSADRNGVERVVKVSAFGAALGSPIHLADQHARTEAHIAEIGMEYTFLRPSFFMQNLLAHASSIQATGTFYAANGAGRAGMIDARDVAATAAAILADGTGHADQAYLLTGPAAVSFFDVASALSAATHKQVTYVPVDTDAAQAAMASQGLPGWLISDLLGLSQAFASGKAEVLTSVVSDVTGRQPRRLEDFASDFAGAFRS